MNMHVCMGYYEIYDRRFLNESIDFIIQCPKSKCLCEVVELDELIAPTIIILNQKGYDTKFCCSGHWYESSANPYIYFEDYVKLPDLPKGFEFDQDVVNSKVTHRAHNTIRKRYSELSSEYQSKFDFVFIANRDLFNWAESLPIVEEY